MKRLLSLLFLSLSLFACDANLGSAFQEGQILYEKHCANCHMSDGSGVLGLIPPLAKSDFLKQADLSVACLIRQGIQGKMQVNGQEYEGEMPPNASLSDLEITNIVNFIHNAWGNSRGFVALPEAEAILKTCKTK